MAIAAVEYYLEAILSEALREFGVCEDFIAQITKRVSLQMHSFLRHWDDLPFRKTLLLLGGEEGPFYEPPAKREVKCFVVTTVRNSPFETLQSHLFEQTGLREALSDQKIKVVTAGAISYFNGLDFAKLNRQAKESDETDFYGEIAADCPVAFTAMRTLAASGKKVATYPKSPVAAPYEVEGLVCDLDQSGVSGMVKAVFDGYSPAFDQELCAVLQAVVRHKSVFYVDSFKMATRNPVKLFQIMEFLLTRDLPFVTCNCYLEHGHVEQRMEPLRAASCHRPAQDMLEHLKQSKGLGHRHALVLRGLLEEAQDPATVQGHEQ